jgi:tRNA A-37 threonylcarbamoyl transferase component Bud32
MEEDTKPHVRQINLEDFPWIQGVDPSLANHNRIETYETAKNILSVFSPNFCNCKNENIRVEKTTKPEIPGTIPTIAILNRVGEKSRAGIVYRIQIGDIVAALKVMPITEENHVNKNIKETENANKLSNLVVENECKFFPLVYAAYKCEDILYPLDSEFLGDALKYAISIKATKKLETTLTEKKFYAMPDKNNLHRTVRLAIRNVKKIPSVLKNMSYRGIESTQEFLNTMADEVNKILEISGIKGSDIKEEDLKPKLEGNLLISELANGDIISYSKYLINKTEKLSNNYWFEILQGVLKGIKAMQSVNIIHNDLHPGNVLILIKNDEILPLIHDFGESEIVKEDETWNLEKRSTDITHFLDTILKTVLIIEQGTAPITDAMSEEFKQFTIDYLKLADDLSQNPETNQETYMELIINKFNEMKTEFFQRNPLPDPTPPPVPPINPIEELVPTPRGGNRKTNSKNKAKTRKTRKTYKNFNKKITKKQKKHSKKKRGSRR